MTQDNKNNVRGVEADMAMLEAVLFTVGDPVKKARLAKVCAFSRERLEQVVEAYVATSEQNRRGLTLVVHDDAVQLVTAPQTKVAVERMLNDARSEELSTAALEVLAIVAYRAPVSRTEVDAIRGVNCSFSLRKLLMRGLIERVQDPDNSRAYLYRVTHDFLSHIGIAKVEELPDFAALHAHPKIDQIKGLS